MKIGLIWAQARGGVIGRNGAMPWHLPEDLAHFKRTTQGHPVIMGRKTWDSLPARFRPLPGRANIVVTRQADWHADGARRASNLRDALQACGTADQAWIIGGAQIFEQAMPLADALVVTEIDADIAGDTHAPAIGPQWQQTRRETTVAANGLELAFVTWRHSAKAPVTRHD